MNTISFISMITVIAGLTVAIFYQVKFNRRLNSELKAVKKERDDLILGFKRMQQNAKKYRVIKEDAFHSDVDELLKRMRAKGEVYPE